jgi:outer membrane putative beta-barrel porin/alpha-amylase
LRRQVPCRLNARVCLVLVTVLCTWLAFAAMPSVCAGADDTWQTGLSLYHSSGDYGTGSTTTVTSVPLSIRRLFDNGDVTLIVPYVSVTGDCGVTLLSGVPNRTGGTCPVVTTANGKRTRTLQTRTTESGLGDIVLRGRYYVLDEQALLPTVALTAKVKFPTADRDRGLGTGEFDEGLGVELYKKLSDAWIGFVDLGYTVLGDPPDVNLRNQWNYNVGAGYYVTKELLLSAYYEGWTAVLPGLSSPRDLLFAVNLAANPIRLNASIARGLSDGSPDWAFMAGLSVRF